MGNAAEPVSLAGRMSRVREILSDVGRSNSE